MRIGVSSYSMSKYRAAAGASYTDLCDLALKLGFDGIEFIDLDTQNPMRTAESIRVHCEKIGLPVAAYTIGANFQTDDLEAEVRRVKACADVARELGAPVMRHDAAFRLKDKPGYGWEKAIEDMAPAIREVTEYAETLGIRTCTENHGYIFQDSERVEKLIRTVNRKNYGWLVDIGNFLCVDENPEEAVRRASGYAFHVHAKDFLYKLNDKALPEPAGFFKTRNNNYLRGTVVGHGAVPVKKCIETLKQSHYDGWISLEFEGMEDNIPALQAGLTYLRACVG